MKSLSRNDLIVIAISYLSFVGLGLANGLINVAWTPMHKEFDLSLDSIGALLTANTVGYLVSSFYSGQLAFRLGAGRMLMLGCGLIVCGLLGTALSPVWVLVVVLALVMNLGGGIIDAGLNAYMAAHYNTRIMNWLHACFGVGITLSPLIVTAFVSSGVSWRAAYIAVFVAQTALLLAYAFTLSNWRSLAAENDSTKSKHDLRVSITDTLKLPMVWFSIGLFLVYVGVEATPGQWIYTLFTESRAVTAELAGVWVSIYWGSLTVGRIFFGIVAPRISTMWLLRACMTGTVIGAFLLWWNPLALGGYAGVMLLGFSQAPLFPLLILTTRQRVGDKHAPNAIGFQVAGAGLGFAFLPSIAGYLAKNISLEIIPPLIFLAAVVGIAMHEFTLWQQRVPIEQPSGAD